METRRIVRKRACLVAATMLGLASGVSCGQTDPGPTVRAATTVREAPTSVVARDRGELPDAATSTTLDAAGRTPEEAARVRQQEMRLRIAELKDRSAGAR